MLFKNKQAKKYAKIRTTVTNNSKKVMLNMNIIIIKISKLQILTAY